MLIVAMVRIRIGQMGISSSLGMCRRRSGGERGVGMDVMWLMGRATRIGNRRHGCGCLYASTARDPNQSTS